MLWKHYGPDSNGIYGGLNGVGGLEAVQDEAGTVYEPNTFAANAYGWGLESLEKSAGKAFAEVLAQNNWHSRRLDPTGLIYMGHRYYSPVLGSFISQDPLGHDTSPGLYDFAYGDPVNYFDTNGLFASKVYQKTGTFIAENLDNIQTSLDAAGMTPGIGNVADIANAAISGARGDLKGMGMRAMAAVPVAGIAVGSALLLDKAVNKAAAGAVQMGTYAGLRNAKIKDAHHIIQDAAVRDLKNYNRGLAPALELKGPSTKIGTPHYLATKIQREAGGGTYAAERKIAYKSLRKTGMDSETARAAINFADQYFSSIGVTKSTPTRLPLNRK